jgi:hypothetical protein
MVELANRLSGDPGNGLLDRVNDWVAENRSKVFAGDQRKMSEEDDIG